MKKKLLIILLSFVGNSSFSQRLLSSSELQEILLQTKSKTHIRTEIFDNETNTLTISRLVFHKWEYIGHSDCKVTKDFQGVNKRNERIRFVRLISDTFNSYFSDSLYFDFEKAERAEQEKKIYSIPVSLKKTDGTINYVLEVRNVARSHSKKRNGKESFFLPFYIHYSEVENFSFKLIETM